MLILNYFSRWSSVSIVECEQVVACDSKILLVNMNKPLHNVHIETVFMTSCKENEFFSECKQVYIHSKLRLIGTVS